MTTWNVLTSGHGCVKCKSETSPPTPASHSQAVDLTNDCRWHLFTTPARQRRGEGAALPRGRVRFQVTGGLTGLTGPRDSPAGAKCPSGSRSPVAWLRSPVAWLLFRPDWRRWDCSCRDVPSPPDCGKMLQIFPSVPSRFCWDDHYSHQETLWIGMFFKIFRTPVTAMEPCSIVLKK